MWRRIIAPAPAGKFPAAALDGTSKPLARLYDKKAVDLGKSAPTAEWRGFYCTISATTVPVIDYLTEDPPPADAYYVCEMRSPTNFVVTKAAPADFGTIHDFDGWPNPNGGSAVVPKVKA